MYADDDQGDRIRAAIKRAYTAPRVRVLVVDGTSPPSTWTGSGSHPLTLSNSNVAHWSLNRARVELAHAAEITRQHGDQRDADDLAALAAEVARFCFRGALTGDVPVVPFDPTTLGDRR